ncbi:MAG: hypothetical protein ACOYJG_09100 [Prevotella sp.]|jgi:hypothetical protein
MKKSFFLVALAASALLVSCNGCSDKKVKPGSVEDIKETYQKSPEMNTTGQDTADVINQVNNFVSYLKNGQVDGAMNMLYYLDGDTIRQVPPKLAKGLRTTLNMVKSCPKYDVEKLTFFREKDSQVKINVTLFEKKANDPRPNTMGMIISPVRRNGKWYLTMADSKSDTNHGTLIEN